MQEQKVEQEIDITKLSNEFTYRSAEIPLFMEERHI